MKWIENVNQLPLLTGLIFIIAGFIMFRFPPKKINMFYGYRTISSMKSQERWDFSQLYSAKKLIYFGFVMLPFAVLGIFAVPERIVNFIVVVSIFFANSIDRSSHSKKIFHFKIIQV